MQIVRLCSEDQHNLSNMAGVKKTTDNMGEVRLRKIYCIFNIGSIYNEHIWTLSYKLIRVTELSTYLNCVHGKCHERWERCSCKISELG